MNTPLSATATTFIWISYSLGLAVYRLYFHHLACFPGPKLAALSRWYEFFYQVYLQGHLVFELQGLHERYDPDPFTEFLTKYGPQPKFEYLAVSFNNETSTATTVSPELHKMRRGALESMFSRQSVRHLLPLLQEKPVNLLKAYMALSQDMIFEYGFGMCDNKLNIPGFQGILYDVYVAAGGAGPFFTQFPIFARILDASPDWLVMKFSPGFAPFIKMRQDFEIEIMRLKETSRDRIGKLHKTVMQEVINNPDLPASEKTRQRLLDESQLIIGAGLSTTGWASAVAIYNILSKPSILARVRAELCTVIPPDRKNLDCTDLDWAALESLPFFQACIKEALRLSYAREWVIPANTPVSVSIYVHNHDETIFPDSHTYNPDRWLTSPSIPDKYFMSFCKGARNCLGMQLAWAELSIMLAGTIRWFDLELFETTVKDVTLTHDFTIPVPYKKSKGVRARILRELS